MYGRVMSMDDERIGEPCPYCGEAVLEEQDSSHLWCPACGSSFDREEIDEAVDFDDDEHDDGD